MLVLTRKIGEEIVLPECQVTIRVVHLGGKRVRLGIEVLREVSVLRSEIPQRTAVPDHPSDNVANGDRSTWSRELERRIEDRSGGRIQALRVETVDERIVIDGRTDSYYGLQLAQAAVREALDASLSEQRPEVQLSIQVP